MSDEKPPTHVLVGTSDGEKLTGERWMSLEDFVKLFTYGETHYADGSGRPIQFTRDIRLKQDFATARSQRQGNDGS